MDLSFNVIKRLPEASSFANLKHLQILYLHDNLIGQWSDLQSIKSAPALVHLTLTRNPVCQIPGYRHQLVNQIKHLKALDEHIITDEERIEFTSPISVRFRALSAFMKINIPKFKENLSADEHLFNVEVDLYRIKRLFERNAPSIRIQSFYRGYLLRSKSYFSYSDRKVAAIRMQKVIRGWLYRLKIKRELQNLLKSNAMDYLMYTQDEYRRFQAMRLIGRAVFRFARKRRRARLLNYSATVIQTIWRGKYAKHHSFIQALNLNSDNRLYFLKEQKLDFIKIVKHILSTNKRISERYTFDQLKSMISQPSDYLLIRYPNPLTFKRHEMPLLQLSTPSLECKVKVNSGLSRLINNGKRITNFYTRFKGMDHEQLILSNLRKRFCHYSSRDTSLIVEKGQSIYQSMKMKKVYDNYQELLVFNQEDKELLILICQQMYFNNLDHQNENFLAFFPHLMNKISAAIKIQQSFRSYLIRQEQKQEYDQRDIIFPVNENFFIQAVIQQRAAQCLSQWWKCFRLKRRLEALGAIKIYLRTIDKSTLYIEESIYMNIDLILEKSSMQMKFMEQNLSFDFKHPNQIIPKQRHSVEQKFVNEQSLSTNSYQSDGYDDLLWHISFQNTGSISERFQNEAFPRWLTAEIPDYHKLKYTDDTLSIFLNNFLGIIHKASFDSLSIVRDFNEIIDSNQKTLNLNNGLNFISLNCLTITEARKRALLVACLTYNMKRKTFIKLFTSTSLCDGVVLKNLYDVWQQYGLSDSDNRMKSLINKQIESIDLQTMREHQKQQSHQGVACSEKDRWSVEGSHLLKFEKIEKPKMMMIHMTTRQRQLLSKQQEFLYISVPNDDDINRIEIKIQDMMPDMDAQYTPTPNTYKLESIQHKQQISQKSSHHHIQSKEPVATLKNISLADINPKHQAQISKQYDLMSMPPSTKSGTAWPSTRYRPSPNSSIMQPNTGKNASINNFFILRKSSYLPSTNVGSQETSPHPNYKGSQISQSHLYSAFVSRKGSELIGEQENASLILQQREEQDEFRLRYKEQLAIDRLIRKDEITKIKQVNQIMKQVVKVEQEANIRMYQRFNKEEKELLEDLKEKERDRLMQEQQTRKQIVHLHYQQKRQKTEERDFALNFSQVRNLIAKQSRIGEYLKHKNTLQKQSRGIVQNIKHQEESYIKHKNDKQGTLQSLSQQRLQFKQPICSTVYDSNHIQEVTFQKAHTANNSPMTRSSNNLNQRALQQPLQQKRITTAQNEITSMHSKNESAEPQRIFEVGLNNSVLINNRKLKFPIRNKRQVHRISFIEENFPLNGDIQQHLNDKL